MDGIQNVFKPDGSLMMPKDLARLLQSRVLVERIDKEPKLMLELEHVHSDNYKTGRELSVERPVMQQPTAEHNDDFSKQGSSFVSINTQTLNAPPKEIVPSAESDINTHQVPITTPTVLVKSRKKPSKKVHAHKTSSVDSPAMSLLHTEQQNEESNVCILRQEEKNKQIQKESCNISITIERVIEMSAKMNEVPGESSTQGLKTNSEHVLTSVESPAMPRLQAKQLNLPSEKDTDYTSKAGNYEEPQNESHTVSMAMKKDSLMQPDVDVVPIANGENDITEVPGTTTTVPIKKRKRGRKKFGQKLCGKESHANILLQGEKGDDGSNDYMSHVPMIKNEDETPKDSNADMTESDIGKVFTVKSTVPVKNRKKAKKNRNNNVHAMPLIQVKQEYDACTTTKHSVHTGNTERTQQKSVVSVLNTETELQSQMGASLVSKPNAGMELQKEKYVGEEAGILSTTGIKVEEQPVSDNQAVDEIGENSNSRTSLTWKDPSLQKDSQLPSFDSMLDEPYSNPAINTGVLDKIKSVWVYRHKTNGLFTYKRGRTKPPIETIRSMFKRTYEPFVSVSQVEHLQLTSGASPLPNLLRKQEELTARRRQRRSDLGKVEFKLPSLYGLSPKMPKLLLRPRWRTIKRKVPDPIDLCDEPSVKKTILSSEGRPVTDLSSEDEDEIASQIEDSFSLKLERLLSDDDLEDQADMVGEEGEVQWPERRVGHALQSQADIFPRTKNNQLGVSPLTEVDRQPDVALLAEADCQRSVSPPSEVLRQLDVAPPTEVIREMDVSIPTEGKRQAGVSLPTEVNHQPDASHKNNDCDQQDSIFHNDVKGELETPPASPLTPTDVDTAPGLRNDEGDDQFEHQAVQLNSHFEKILNVPYAKQVGEIMRSAVHDSDQVLGEGEHEIPDSAINQGKPSKVIKRRKRKLQTKREDKTKTTNGMKKEMVAVTALPQILPGDNTTKVKRKYTRRNIKGTKDEKKQKGKLKEQSVDAAAVNFCKLSKPSSIVDPKPPAGGAVTQRVTTPTRDSNKRKRKPTKRLLESIESDWNLTHYSEDNMSTSPTPFTTVSNFPEDKKSNSPIPVPVPSEELQGDCVQVHVKPVAAQQQEDMIQTAPDVAPQVDCKKRRRRKGIPVQGIKIETNSDTRSIQHDSGERKAENWTINKNCSSPEDTPRLENDIASAEEEFSTKRTGFQGLLELAKVAETEREKLNEKALQQMTNISRIQDELKSKLQALQDQRGRQTMQGKERNKLIREIASTVIDREMLGSAKLMEASAPCGDQCEALPVVDFKASSTQGELALKQPGLPPQQAGELLQPAGGLPQQANGVLIPQAGGLQQQANGVLIPQAGGPPQHTEALLQPVGGPSQQVILIPLAQFEHPVVPPNGQLVYVRNMRSPSQFAGQGALATELGTPVSMATSNFPGPMPYYSSVNTSGSLIAATPGQPLQPVGYKPPGMTLAQGSFQPTTVVGPTTSVNAVGTLAPNSIQPNVRSAMTLELQQPSPTAAVRVGSEQSVNLSAPQTVSRERLSRQAAPMTVAHESPSQSPSQLIGPKARGSSSQLTAPSLARESPSQQPSVPKAHSRKSILQVLMDKPLRAHSKPANYSMYSQLKCTVAQPAAASAAGLDLRKTTKKRDAPETTPSKSRKSFTHSEITSAFPQITKLVSMPRIAGQKDSVQSEALSRLTDQPNRPVLNTSTSDHVQQPQNPVDSALVPVNQRSTNEQPHENSTVQQPFDVSSIKELQICQTCRMTSMFICSGCHSVAYCSVKCQAIAWESHFKVCQ